MKLAIIKQRKTWWAVSLSIILAGIIAMIISWQQFGAPLRPSLDFIGGTKLQYELDCGNPQNCIKPIDINAIRQIADSQGLTGSTIQNVGKTGFSIRSRELKQEARDRLTGILNEKIGQLDANKTKIDTIGPTFGRQLFEWLAGYWPFFSRHLCLFGISIPAGLCFFCICGVIP